MPKVVPGKLLTPFSIDEKACIGWKEPTGIFFEIALLKTLMVFAPEQWIKTLWGFGSNELSVDSKLSSGVVMNKISQLEAISFIL